MYAWPSNAPTSVAGSSWPIFFRATLTIVPSRKTMPDPRTTADRIQRALAGVGDRVTRFSERCFDLPSSDLGRVRTSRERSAGVAGGRLGYDRRMPQAPDLDAQLDVAVDAARRAGRIQMERYERLERIVHKSEHDVVTEVDNLSEALIIEALSRVFPGDAFLAEESGHSGGSAKGAPGPAATTQGAHDSASGHGSGGGGPRLSPRPAPTTASGSSTRSTGP